MKFITKIWDRITGRDVLNQKAENACSLINKFCEANFKLNQKLIASSKLLQVPVAPKWDVEEAQVWKAFLLSKCGQDILTKARAMEAATCVKACSGEGDHKLAGGISFTLNWLESLANVEAITSASLEKDANTEASTHPNAESLTEIGYH